MIERFLDALVAAKLDLSGEEIADALWLASHIRLPVEASKIPPSMTTRPPEAFGTTEPEEKRKAKEGHGAPAGESRPAEVHLPASSGTTADHLGRRGRAVQSPGVPALPGALGIARSLRPLMRRVPTRRRLLLDEEATVARIAEGGPKVPVLKPAPERWLDLALVVDASPTMVLWRQTCSELRLLLECHGAFRDVRLWSLTADKGQIRLQTGLGVAARPGNRSPRELVDPSGRRLVVVVSDCVSEAWHQGKVEAQALSIWARSGPLVLLQVLPERLWQRTSLAIATDAHLAGSLPGLPSQRLRVRSHRHQWRPVSSNELALPVVTMEPRLLSAWARMVAGFGASWVPGKLLELAGVTRETTTDGSPESGAGEPLTAAQRIRGFRANASPTARKLAGYLAAAPLSLPVMRLVQAIMLPESRQVHLAEVFLGGLLKQVSSDVDISPEEVQYEFEDGVRDLLLNEVRRSETLRVVEEVSAWLDRQQGVKRGFRALMEDPSSTDGIAVGEGSRPFASITAGALRRLGLQQYQQAAPEFEKAVSTGSIEETGTDNVGISATAKSSPHLQDAAPLPDHPPVIPPKIQAEILDFSRLILEKTRTFVGQGSVFAAIDRFLSQESRGYLLILGSPGSGKTDLVAELVKRRGYIHHFVSRGGRTAEKFLRNVCAQLIARYRLGYDSLPPEAGKNGAFLLHVLSEISKQGEEVVLLVDGLDEARPEALPAGVNRLYLPISLPERTFIIVTTRTHDKALLVDAPQAEIDLDDSEDTYQSALAFYQQMEDRLGEAATRKSLGDLYLRTDRLNEAAEAYQSALAFYQQMEDRLGEANTRKSLGDLYLRTDRLNEATEAYQSALAFYQQMEDRLGEANTRKSLGDLYLRTDRLNKAAEAYTSAQALYQQMEDRRGEANARQTLGDLYVSMGRLSEAEEAYQGTLFINQALSDRRGEANTRQTLGDLYVSMGRLSEAEEAYQGTLFINQALSDRRGEANTRQTLGNLYVNMGRLSEAEEAYQKALFINQALSDRQGEANTRQTLGDLYASMGRLSEAEEAYQSALFINQASSDRRGEANTRQALGDLYVSMGRLSQAEKAYQSALFINQELSDQRGEANTRQTLGDLYVSMGRLSQAEEAYQSALFVNQVLGDRRGEASTRRALDNLFVRTDRQREAEGHVEEPVRLGIRSMIGGGAGMTTWNDAVLDLVHFFDGRHIRKREYWQDEIFPRLRHFLRGHIDPNRPVQLDVATHSSIAFAAGWLLEAKSGLDVKVVQRTAADGEIAWNPNDGSVGALWLDRPDIVLSPEAPDVALAIAVSQPYVAEEVQEFIRTQGLSVGRIIDASIGPEPGPRSVRGGAHALRLAQKLVLRLRQRAPLGRMGTLHLFCASPNAFLFYLGQLARSLGRIVIYEYTFRSQDSYSHYQRALELPPNPKEPLVP